MAVNGSIFTQTKIGDYYFDAYISIGHTSTLNITQHPVESGGVIADHAYLMPREITMKLAVSDAMVNPLSSFGGDDESRSINAYRLLQQLQRERTPLTVYTKFETYENCLIRDLSTEDDADHVESLEAEVTLVELPTAYLETSKISVDWQTTNETINGIQEAQALGEKLEGTTGWQIGMGLADYNVWGMGFGSLLD